jgi:2-keto-3-deoxy-L-fuconate dehydrogenase
MDSTSPRVSERDVANVTSAPLAGRTAIVTGAGSGIGQAIALLFAARGARVGMLDIGELGQTLAAIEAGGGEAMAVRCDVSNQADVTRAFADVRNRFGALDVLVNSAGVAHIGTVETTTEEDLDRIYRVNVRGVYNCLKLGVSAMKGRGGAILNIASVAATVGIPDRFAYSMSKGAVLTMTYSVARDFIAEKIRCNCVSPARIHTPFVDGFLAKNYPGREPEMFEKLARSQPIGRMGRPDEVAELALFLCSDAAAFITGSNYAIDGGFIALKM